MLEQGSAPGFSLTVGLRARERALKPRRAKSASCSWRFARFARRLGSPCAASLSERSDGGSGASGTRVLHRALLPALVRPGRPGGRRSGYVSSPGPAAKLQSHVAYLIRGAAFRRTGRAFWREISDSVSQATRCSRCSRPPCCRATTASSWAFCWPVFCSPGPMRSCPARRARRASPLRRRSSSMPRR
eukprot:scaffold554_cov245-Pinguiococcus_pyrenoidosus.AAC.5